MVVQSGKPLHFGTWHFTFFMATRSHKKLLRWFRAFVFRYIRSDELFVQQPVLHNEGRLSWPAASANIFYAARILSIKYPLWHNMLRLCIEGLRKHVSIFYGGKPSLKVVFTNPWKVIFSYIDESESGLKFSVKRKTPRVDVRSLACTFWE